jgi:hypothetical protein
MFDNVAFEVVIGLVFIYLLYSLLVTILGEIISTFLGIRARLLRVAIERMLNDGYYFKIEKKEKGNKLPWRRGTVLTEHDDFRKSFAGKFYEYPAIKYLGRIEKERKGKLSLSKPSYISADYFADSLISFLADKGAGITVMDKVGFCLKFNTYHIQANTLRQFINLFETATTLEAYKVNLMKWFNETMDRANGWHKRKMRFISFLLGLALAMSFNIDTTRIAKILANDKEARAQLVSMGVALAKDSSRYNEFVTDNGDTVHSQAILDTGFARLKNDINAANLVLGLGWDFSNTLKEDHLDVNRADSSSRQLQRYVDSLKLLTTRTNAIAERLKDSLIWLTINRQQLDSIYADTTIALNLSIISKAGYTSDSNARFIADTTRASLLQKKINILFTHIKIDSGALKANRFLTASLSADINKETGKNFMVIDSISHLEKEGLTRVYGKRKYKDNEKLGYLLSHIFWFNLAGFLLTALALSMGAPFWFDLLNKLVSIRGVGIKPEEKKANPVTEIDNTLYQKDGLPSRLIQQIPGPVADVVEAALKFYTSQLKAIPGVKSVFSVVKKGERGVQVNVNNATTKAEVMRQFPELLVGNVSVPYYIVDSGTPSSQTGPKGIIANRSGKNGFGSLGCILTRKETGSKHILSCWHVLKGDLNYSGSDNETFIVDHTDGSYLAERWAGGIRDQFDYGLAKCAKESLYQDNSFLKSKLGMGSTKLDYRFVSQGDIDKQIPVKYYNGLTNKVTQGIIYTDSLEVDINYIDKTRTIKDILILTNEDETTISKEGNSGSIVFDEKNKAIAMIIGGDLKYTYAVKLSHLFKIHGEMDMA